MLLRFLTLSGCVLALTLATGCPSDEEDGEGGAGEGGGGSGGGGGGEKVSPEAAAGGACEMMGGGGEAQSCTGIDEYTECANTKCGLDDCLSGECADYLDCLSNASDACEAVDSGACTSPSECNTCLQNAGLCAFNMGCIDLIQCGERVEGGACDRVDACCASLDSLQAMACNLQASAVKSAGDDACQSLLDGYSCD